MLSSAGRVVGAVTDKELDRELDNLADKAHVTTGEMMKQLERTGAPVGTYDRLRDEFSEMEALGITRFYIQGGYDPERTPGLLDAISR
jgi:hypothetical protein